MGIDLLSDQELVTLEVEAGKVLYEEPKSGYKVMLSKCRGLGDVRMVGIFPDVALKTPLRCEGQWEQHRKYGMNFKVATMQVIMPTTKDGILAYLQSGLIKGVGKVTAKKVVDWFGERTLEVIKNEPSKLRAIPGVRSKNLQALVRGVREQGAVEEIMVWLTARGLSASLALKIHREFGESALAVLTNDVYRLTEIPGVGFATADAAALKIGVARDSIERIRAGVIYALEFASLREGSTGLDANELVTRAGELLDLKSVDLIGEARDMLILDGKCVATTGMAGTIIQLAKYASQEALVAKSIAKMLSVVGDARHFRPIDSPETLVAVAEKESQITLDDSQRAAVLGILQNPVSIMVGGPGTGKTSSLKVALLALAHGGVHTVLAAPTGKAARRMAAATGQEASTLHMLLKQRKGNRDPLASLCVDESSMMDLSLAASTMGIVGPGSRLILVGDTNQLASVGAGAILRDLITSGCVPTYRLTKIHRQAAGSRIVMNAHAIIEGRGRDMEFGEDFRFCDCEDDAILAAKVRQTVQALVARGTDPVFGMQILCPGHRGPAGDTALNTEIQNLVNPSPAARIKVGSIELRTGDKVTCTKNNYDLGIRNGSMGRIAAIDEEEREVTVEFELEGSITFESGDLDLLGLGYAGTVHRSQGSEVDVVLMTMSTSHYPLLTRNLFYTGVTRAKKAVFLLGQKKAVRAAVSRTLDLKRTTTLDAQLVDAMSAHLGI
ncbi:MAG: ATP-dependent RecD-like DNA helicase [Rhizobium sp.]|nr:MAG: ATP-dependent RecD-like DNA helicase [Rhizobium sp.]